MEFPKSNGREEVDWLVDGNWLLVFSSIYFLSPSDAFSTLNFIYSTSFTWNLCIILYYILYLMILASSIIYSHYHSIRGHSYHSFITDRSSILLFTQFLAKSMRSQKLLPLLSWCSWEICGISEGSSSMKHCARIHRFLYIFPPISRCFQLATVTVHFFQ